MDIIDDHAKRTAEAQTRHAAARAAIYADLEKALRESDEAINAARLRAAGAEHDALTNLIAASVDLETEVKASEVAMFEQLSARLKTFMGEKPAQPAPSPEPPQSGNATENGQ